MIPSYYKIKILALHSIQNAVKVNILGQMLLQILQSGFKWKRKLKSWRGLLKLCSVLTMSVSFNQSHPIIMRTCV